MLGTIQPFSAAAARSWQSAHKNRPVWSHFHLRTYDKSNVRDQSNDFLQLFRQLPREVFIRVWLHSDGTTVAFVVETLADHTQAGFPTEEVYGDIDHAGLRLVTCSGFFDHDEQQYSHNLIVFAVLQS